MSESANNPNEDYYNTNAVEYQQSTLMVDMQPIYDLFLPIVKPNGHILDAGCGSGRDAKAFDAMGYQVTAMDSSKALATLASAYTGLNVEHRKFDQINEHNRYDGIWCCASLLHVPLTELNQTFSRLANALKINGMLYVSFKYGEPSSVPRTENGRTFTDLTEINLTEIIAQVPSLKIDKLWQSQDRRASNNTTTWLNALITKGNYD